MTHFPQKSAPRPAKPANGTGASPKPGLLRDLVWGRPVFKAPALPNPRIVFDPLPFQAARVTAPRRHEAPGA
ncbi:MAG TPA: hypothetical protein VEB66_11005 [Opitutaceae bacterium]|nr:hypothetical protein [Opitutaceae bacterium]